MKQFTINISTYVAETTIIDGIDYLSVPVTMLVEGVLNGSAGPVFHSISEASKTVQDWNGVPLTLEHPKTDTGFVSVNASGMVDAFQIGFISNARTVGNQLKAIANFNIIKTTEKDAELIQHLRDSEPIEVSTGVFIDEVSSSGTWNGVEYKGIATNHRPDHLAVLPKSIGACSIDDGCGIRNEENKTKEDMAVKKIDIVNALMQPQDLTVNEIGYQAIINSIQRQLDGFDTQTSSYYLQELFTDRFIYRVSMQSQPTKYYQRGYLVNDKKEIEFVGEPTEVRQEVNYITNQKQLDMANEKSCCPKKVTALIGNSKTKLTEDDRNWLEQLTSEQLDSIEPITVHEEPKPVVHTAESLKEAIQTYSTEMDKVLEVLPDEMQVHVKAAIKLQTEKKEALVQSVLTNSKSVWTKEELSAFEIPMLEKLAKTTGVVTDYTVRDGIAVHEDANYVAPLMPADYVAPEQ